MNIYLIAARSSWKDMWAGYFQTSIPLSDGKLLLAVGRINSTMELWQRRAKAREVEQAILQQASQTTQMETLLAALKKQRPELQESPLAIALLASDGSLQCRVQHAQTLVLRQSDGTTRSIALTGETIKLSREDLGKIAELIFVEGNSKRAQEIVSLCTEVSKVLGEEAVSRVLLGGSNAPVEAALLDLRRDVLAAVQPKPTQTQTLTKPSEAENKQRLPWFITGFALLVMLVFLFWKSSVPNPTTSIALQPVASNSQATSCPAPTTEPVDEAALPQNPEADDTQPTPKPTTNKKPTPSKPTTETKKPSTETKKPTDTKKATDTKKTTTETKKSPQDTTR